MWEVSSNETQCYSLEDKTLYTDQLKNLTA